MKARWLVLLGVLFVAVSADAALAWGPATHVQLASQLLAEASVAGVAVMSLLLKHAKHFLYGNIAADVVFGKRLSKVKHSCHKWSMALKLLEAARNNEQKVFAYGYLTHLAADVVAHNKFVPRQVLLARTTVNVGHLVWELRADTQASAESWSKLHETLVEPFPEHERLLEQHLADTFFSFGTNLKIFNRMNMLASARNWRGLVGQWGRLSRWPVEPEVLGAYQAESLALMRLALKQADDPELAGLEPSGAATLDRVRRDRKLLRRLSWQGLSGRWLATNMVVDYAPAIASPVRRTSVA